MADTPFNPVTDGEVLLVPRATLETLTTLKRYEAFRFWNHAMLLRRHEGAAQVANSAAHLVNVKFESTNPMIRTRCAEVLDEVDRKVVKRLPQIA